MQPRQIRDTLRPVWPRLTYSMPIDSVAGASRQRSIGSSSIRPAGTPCFASEHAHQNCEKLVGGEGLGEEDGVLELHRRGVPGCDHDLDVWPGVPHDLGELQPI